MVSQNGVGRLFGLIFIELRRIEGGSAHVRERRHLTGIIRNLEVAVVAADEQGKSASIVEDVGQIAEKLVLIGVVMNWVAASRRIFDSDTVMQITRA